MDLGLSFAGDPGAFWRWSPEDQVSAVAYHRIGLTLQPGEDPTLSPENEESAPLTALSLRYAMSRPLTLGDLSKALRDAFAPSSGGFPAPEIDMDAQVEAARARRRE